MSRQAPTVLVGLDAFDPGLAVELAAAGRLPTIAKLLGDGAQATVRNPYGLFVGATWPTLTTGQEAGRVGYHSWLEVDSRTMRRELRSPERVGPAFWEAVGRGGHRVAVLDVPHRRAGGELNGVQVSEWGCHDRHWGLRSTPPELAAELVDRYGLHPVLGLDPYSDRDFAPDDHFARTALVRTAEEDVELTAGLLDGIERKCALSVDVMGREPWDLFVAVFGESHAAGHHLWHHHDPNHPRHDPVVAQRLDDPLARIYERLDDAVGEHLARVPDEATFLLLLSHGMTAHYDGTHLIEEVLRRLDAFAAGEVTASLHSRALLAAPRSVRGPRPPARGGGAPAARRPPRPPGRAGAGHSPTGGASGRTTTGRGSGGSCHPTTPCTAACG